MLLNSEKLVALITAIFVELKATTSDAKEVAEHLVTANLKGHDSHGVGMVPTYVSNILRGKCDVKSNPSLVQDDGAIMLIDAKMGFGQVAGRKAIDMAIQRLDQTGLVCLGVRNCHHLGRIGSYAERCSEAGYISIHFVNVVGHDPLVAPFGGKESRLGTNPFCCAIPRGNGPPIVLDMATSAIAHGKVRVAYMKDGGEVPNESLIDSEGNATQNPSVMFEEPLGSMLPFGGHKGYGLALICELLGGALAGKWTASKKSHEKDGFNIVNHMLTLIINPSIFGEKETFEEEVQNMIDYLKSTKTKNHNREVLVAGEPELDELATRSKTGISIDENSWEAIIKAAKDSGLSDKTITSILR